MTPDEIDAILDETGTEVRPGDALCSGPGTEPDGSRTVRDRVQHVGRAGWHASCLPWFHRRQISLISADTATDVIPSGYDRIRIPIHAVGIAAMGLWLLVQFNLESLASTCAELGTNEFEYLVAPLPFVGAIGSPSIR